MRREDELPTETDHGRAGTVLLQEAWADSSGHPGSGSRACRRPGRQLAPRFSTGVGAQLGEAALWRPGHVACTSRVPISAPRGGRAAMFVPRFRAGGPPRRKKAGPVRLRRAFAFLVRYQRSAQTCRDEVRWPLRASWGGGRPQRRMARVVVACTQHRAVQGAAGLPGTVVTSGDTAHRVHTRVACRPFHSLTSWTLERRQAWWP